MPDRTTGQPAAAPAGLLRVLAAPAHTGKTAGLIDWLLGGSPRGGWLGWDRVLVSPDRDRIAMIELEFAAQDAALRQVYPPGLSRLVMTPRRALGVLMGTHGVAIAVDDAEQLLAGVLGGRPPAVVAVGGAHLDPVKLAHEARQAAWDRDHPLPSPRSVTRGWT